jgi:uncharacterized membrane protein
VTDLPPPPPPPPPPSWSPPPSGAGSPDVGTALSYGWAKFQTNVGPLLGVIGIQLVVQLGLSIIGRVVIHSTVGVVIFQIFVAVVNAALGIGIYQMALMITAGETPDVAKAFQSDRWGEWIVFSLVFGLMVGVGLALCIIPGLLVLAYFGLAPFFFLDGRMGLGEALTASRTAVTANGLAFPILLSIIVGVLGIIACFIGIFVTLPIAYLAVAFIYRNATGRPVAA